MSDFDSLPDDGLDHWLANQHDNLVVDIAAILGVQAGLCEALIPIRHAYLIDDLGHSLDIDAGLAAIMAATPSMTLTNESLTAALLSSNAEHVDETVSNQAEIEQPELLSSPKRFIRAAIFGRSRTPPVQDAQPVSKCTALRDAAQARARNFGRVRQLIIALVIIVLGAAATAVIGKIPPSTPTTTTLPLDVLDYGVTAQTRVDTLMFTLTIKARGAGTLHNTWQLDNRGSSQPMGSESMTFTGPIQIKEVVYSVPFSCDRGQRLEGEMRVEMTKPEPISRASYAPYDFTCH